MGFEDLDVWKRAARLAAEILRELDDSREFAFKDQITRSALSIVRNVEGFRERECFTRSLEVFPRRRVEGLRPLPHGWRGVEKQRGRGATSAPSAPVLPGRFRVTP
jgi:hypothetical protein